MASGEVELERMIVRLIGDASSYRRMWGAAEAAATASVASINSTMQRLGVVTTLGVTAPLVAMGKSATNEFSRFDQAMTETFARMGTVAPEVRNEMEELAKTLSMGGSVAFSPTELAKGYEELGAVGLNAAQAMAILPDVAKFAQAGVFGMDVAVKGLVGSIAAFRGGLPKDTQVFAQDVRTFGDLIVAVANETQTSVELMSTSMTRDASTAARMYGMELSTLGAILGVYAQQNYVGAEAGNMTGRALRLATSSFLKHRAVWESMGIRMIDPITGKWTNFIDVIGMMETAFKGLTGPQIAAKLHMMGLETLSQKSILPLIGLSDELKRQQEIYKGTGAMIEMARIQMMSWANQMKVVMNYVKVLRIEVGQYLAPMISVLGEYVKMGVATWRSWSKETQRAAVVFGVIAAFVGPALIIFTTIAKVVSLAAVGFGLIASVIGYILSPLSLLVIGVGLLAASFLDLDLKGFWDGAVAGISNFMELSGAFFGNFRQNMGILLSWLGDRWSAVWGGLSYVVRESALNILEIFGQLFPNLGWWFKDMAANGGDAWQSLLDAATGFFEITLGFFSNFAENMDLVWKFFKGNWRNVLSDVGMMFSVMFENMFKNLGVALGIMVRMLVAFGGWIAGMFRRLFSFEVVDAILTGLIKMGQMVRDWGAAAWDELKAAVTGGKSKAFDNFGAAWLRDVQNGVNNVNLLDTFAGIIREESGNFVNPLQGFSPNSVHGLPQFNLEVPRIGLPQFNLAKEGQPLAAAEKAAPTPDNMVAAFAESGVVNRLMTLLERIAVGVEKNKPPLLNVAELS